jgi:3-oxoacyl-[acyl-carrier-protein] synthase-3
MPQAILSQAMIAAMHTVVGPVERRIDDDLSAFGGNTAKLERLKKTIGLDRRRVVEGGTTAVDLCLAATLKLKLEAEPDALIFVTQTPDHFQPCNAAVLHGKLGWGEGIAAFDVNLGCSGWVYGLYLASLMIESGGCERVLLAAGDTMSRTVHPRDRATASLFGDAGSATLIERRKEPSEAWFALHTRGAAAGHLCIPAGAFRQPITEATGHEVTDDDGNTRTPENLYMNGVEIFNFAMMDEPKAVEEIMEISGQGVDDIETFAFHQANKYILGNIARRLKIPAEKVPIASVGRFGNLSSASIPGVLCDERGDALLSGSQQLLVSGFGVGLSWASAILQCGLLRHCALSIYEEV